MSNHFSRALACLLALLCALSLFVACADRGTPLLILNTDKGNYTYSVNLYQLTLAYAKGQLSANNATVNGLKPTDNKYWDVIDDLDGKRQTLNQYYCETLLEQCRYSLIALYLFDRYNLSLSEKEKEEIAKKLEELVLTDGGGSKNKLNSVLLDYGINYDMMEEHYTNTAKIKALYSHLYSLIGANIKQEYMEEHYIHFNQIFLAKYNYVYKTDDNGDIIYYNPSTSSVCYKETDYYKTENGNRVYYTDSTYSHISYDTEKGEPAYKLSADGSSPLTEPLDEEALQALEERADLLTETLQDASKADFEAAIVAYSDDAGVKEYTDGYYLSTDLDYTASGEDYLYIDSIITQFKTMENGDITLVESPAGYHIVMKYAYTKGAYEKEENQVWFESFESALTDKVFQEEAKAYYAQVTTDQAVLTTAPDMKSVLPNYFYY